MTFAVAALAPVARYGAWQGASAIRGVMPLMRHVAAGGIVAHHHHSDIGRLRGLGCGAIGLIGGIVDLHIRANQVLDALQRRDRIRRRAAIPIPMHRVGQRPDDRNRLDRSFLSGRNEFEFFSSTTDSSASFCETALSLSVFHGSGESLIVAYGTIAGGSSKPSLTATRNLRPSSSSISFSVIEPSFSAALVSSAYLSRN